MTDFATTTRRAFLGAGAALAAGAATAYAAPGDGSCVSTLPDRWDREADVVVVGFGAAGASAAIAAHDKGAKVLLLEKAPEQFRGGNSRVSGQVVFWPVDIEKGLAYFKGMSGPYVDNISDEMARVWATEMHLNRQWLEGLGMQPRPFEMIEFPELQGSDGVQVIKHSDGPIGRAALWNEVIEPALNARKIERVYETAATNLVKRNNEIVGIIASQGGKRIAIKAHRAVVLTCGGFENNPAMIRNYLNDMPYCYPLGSPYNTGDGIRMAMAAGADLWHMNNIAGPFFCFKAPDVPVAARFAASGSSYLWVGRDGNRFMTETATYTWENGRQIYLLKHGKIYLNGRYIQSPTPVPMHVIFDEATRKAGGVCGKSAGWTYTWDIIHAGHGMHEWSSDNLREIEKGWIKKADSIAELATLIGLQPAVLEATVERYNSSCQAKKDPEFNRRPGSLVALKGPPYYAMALSPCMLNTQGGPRRNKDAQIVDTNGAPIPRLYSAGELGAIYAFQYNGGGNMAECFAFGRIAGTNAAAQKPWA